MKLESEIVIKFVVKCQVVLELEPVEYWMVRELEPMEHWMVVELGPVEC